MKPRPRSVEREVAQLLSEHLEAMGDEPTERIPVLGRTGPDLRITQLGLVVDVKSRQAVPDCFAPAGAMVQIGDELIGVRLDEMMRLFEAPLYPDLRRHSETIYGWWLHMDMWRRRRFPFGVSALVLHRPGKRIAQSMFVIHLLDWRKLYDRRTAIGHGHRRLRASGKSDRWPLIE